MLHGTPGCIAPGGGDVPEHIKPTAVVRKVGLHLGLQTGQLQLGCPWEAPVIAVPARCQGAILTCTGMGPCLHVLEQCENLRKIGKIQRPIAQFGPFKTMCFLPSLIVWGRSEALHIAACASLSTLPLHCKVWKIVKFGGIILYTIADVCMGNLLQALWSVRDDWCWAVCHSKFRIIF